MASAGPLAGLTVLDLTRVLSGPYCTMLLGDMGARVIKIEQPGRGDDTRAWGPPFVNGESTYFLSINRNKESVTLDFKDTARTADSRSAGRASRCSRRELPPGHAGAVSASITSRCRPRTLASSTARSRALARPVRGRHQPGYDAVVQAEGGLMSVTGTPMDRRFVSASPLRI